MGKEEMQRALNLVFKFWIRCKASDLTSKAKYSAALAEWNKILIDNHWENNKFIDKLFGLMFDEAGGNIEPS